MSGEAPPAFQSPAPEHARREVRELVRVHAGDRTASPQAGSTVREERSGRAQPVGQRKRGVCPPAVLEHPRLAVLVEAILAASAEQVTLELVGRRHLHLGSCNDGVRILRTRRLQQFVEGSWYVVAVLEGLRLAAELAQSNRHRRHCSLLHRCLPMTAYNTSRQTLECHVSYPLAFPAVHMEKAPLPGPLRRGAEGGIRTPTPFRAHGPKPCASAVPPLPPGAIIRPFLRWP